MHLNSTRLASIAVVGAVAFAGPGTALAATPTEAQAFATKLATYMKPVFKKQAPKLVLGKVTCVLPKNGNVVHCKAHFAYPSGGLNIVYQVKATLLETGMIKWTAGSHTCTNAKTGKTVSC
jgi:hypothetical protein